MAKDSKRTKKEVYYCNNLRTVWKRSPMYWEAMNRAKQAPNVYECEGCTLHFKLRDVDCDHIEPVVDPAVGWVDMATFAQRLNCQASGLQVLCKDDCHVSKTKVENKNRSKTRAFNRSSQSVSQDQKQQVNDALAGIGDAVKKLKETPDEAV